MNIKHLVRTVLATLAIAGFSTTAVASYSPGFWRRHALQPLEGTWVVTINPTFCTTTAAGNAGDDVPGVPPVTAYLTFARGGTMTESNSNAAFEPGQRGPGHGYWDRTGRTSYQFAFQAFIQFDSTLAPFRYKRGYQRLDQTLELHTDDEFTSSGSVRFFAGTSTTDILLSGCARSTGERLY